MDYKKPLTAEIVRHIQEFYGVQPDFLWEKSPDAAALRHINSKKWFGVLLLDTPKKRLGIDDGNAADIIVLKCDPILIGSLIAKSGYLPGYHMNKEHWITALLDGTVSAEEIYGLIDMSYEMTKGKK